VFALANSKRRGDLQNIGFPCERTGQLQLLTSVFELVSGDGNSGQPAAASLAQANAAEFPLEVLPEHAANFRRNGCRSTATGILERAGPSSSWMTLMIAVR